MKGENTVDIEKCINPKCGKKFSYSEVGGGMPGTKESEECLCPYCGTVAFRQRINGVFVTSEINQDEE